jgi:hypothetical protein
MKNKKLFLPTIIFGVAVLAIAVYALVSNVAVKPTVTEGAFPFSITYELDGEQVTISDVYNVHYDRNERKYRVYLGETGNSGEEKTVYTLKKDNNGRIELWTYLYADYLMGDPQYDYFDDSDFEPKIYYFNSEEHEFHDEETLAAQGVKLIGFTYPTPIENSFTFSHITYASGEIVLPILLISLLALMTTMIFVRKEKDLKYKAVDIISIILNFVISATLLPFLTVLAAFIDIEGGGPEFYYQITYLLPTILILCTTASVALRRKGHGVTSLISQLIGPAVFALYLLVFYAAHNFF